MTMQEQVLTLFGGWAKAQILPPIKTGVVKTSVTPSVSTYISNSYTPTEKKHFSVTVSISNELFSDGCKSDKSLAYVLNEYNIRPRVEAYREEKRTFYDEWGQLQSEENSELLDPKEKWIRREYGDQGQYIDYVPTGWTRVFLRTWFDKAFLRFFEIWERGTHATIVRGLDGTDKMKRSISGMIGGNYNGGFKDANKALTKLPNGEYALNSLRLLHQRVPRLPKEGIDAARKLARQSSDRRKNKNL